MKTAKEVCESIKNERLMEIIRHVKNRDGSCEFFRLYNNVKKYESELKELGYTVEYKEIDERYFFKLFGAIKKIVIVSACCGEEK